MKKLIYHLLAMSLMLFLVLSSAFAQEPIVSDNPFHQGTTSGEVFNWYTGVYSAIVILLTYIQGVIKSPFLAKIKPAVKYIVIAVVVGLLFYTLGWLNAIGIVIAFVSSALAYDKVLKPPGLKTANNT